MSSSLTPTALGDLLAFFGNVADYAAGAPPEHGERVAALAVHMGKFMDLPNDELGALYFAARLRNAGALGNPAFAKTEPLSERAAKMAAWDVPTQGARICEQLAALPRMTADIARWQSESWDGTGFPDQIRWKGIPKPAQLLHIAATFVANGDSEEAFSEINSYGGRRFAPDETRAFVMWYHTNDGTIEPVDMPYEVLAPARTAPDEIVSMLASALDAHNATPGRASRIKHFTLEIGRILGFAPELQQHAALAAELFAIGELRATQTEAEQFDPLARLGLEMRAEHALQASALMSTFPAFAGVAAIVAARSEWYDGTGAPHRLRNAAIPQGAQALSVAIAYDALYEKFRTRIGSDRTLPISRMETAAGTQFDPEAVRALAEVVKAHA